MDLGQAHESALKEAETDAMKRALMTFGNPFGLALYDRRQREVTSSAAQERPAAQARPAQPAAQHQARASTPAEPLAQAAAPPSQQDPGLVPLNAATIRTLHGAICQLPLRLCFNTCKTESPWLSLLIFSPESRWSRLVRCSNMPPAAPRRLSLECGSCLTRERRFPCAAG
jgi:hypothetical protein